MAIPTFSMFLFSNIYIILFLVILISNLNKGNALQRRETIVSYHHNIQLSSMLPSSVCIPSTKGTKKKSSLKVVHRHGPCSKFNVDKENVPTLSQILSLDQSRVNSIQSLVKEHENLQESKATTNIPAQSGISLGSGNYIVTVGFGTPDNDLSLAFDTGSDLTWIQCQPCAKSCYDQEQPIFDPSTSTSYSNIACNSALCSNLGATTQYCSGSTCLYDAGYGDESYTKGYYAKEKLTLSQTDIFTDFVFGCGQDNEGIFGRTAGLLGLGRGEVSLVSQTAQTYGKFFSYCLPSSQSSTGYLTFGNNGVSSNVQFTPFANSNRTPYYFIDITDIYVGGTKLSISPTTFSTPGFVIDSGTVISRLPPAAYSSLQAAFRQQMTQYPTAPPLENFDTCYDFSNYEWVRIPKISFIFNGNVIVDIAPSGILHSESLSQSCLAFAGNSDASDIGIFGNLQQKTLEVVYDVAGEQLGFGQGGCA